MCLAKLQYFLPLFQIFRVFLACFHLEFCSRIKTYVPFMINKIIIEYSKKKNARQAFISPKCFNDIKMNILDLFKRFGGLEKFLKNINTRTFNNIVEHYLSSSMPCKIFSIYELFTHPFPTLDHSYLI